ncbi:MAG TPA: hypothetical protein VIV12_15485 [Streptosporangiaceae bacterium]
MALIEGGSVALSVAQTGNGDSTNIAARLPSGVASWPAASLIITSAIGATPTVTVNIQGSADGTNWFNVPYYAGAFVVAPTYILTAIVITTAVTTQYTLQAGVPWRYLKLVYSANTNVTLTAGAYL